MDNRWWVVILGLVLCALGFADIKIYNSGIGLVVMMLGCMIGVGGLCSLPNPFDRGEPRLPD